MSRHLALVTSKREATLKPRAEGIAWIGILISFLSSSFHQKRPGRDGVFWQELAPPGGELTSQDDGYDRHKMARGAITHNLYVCPPSPFLPSSMSPRCYNFATQKGPALRVFCTHQGLLFTLSS
jgi:hypothetical protein